ncbi:MAG: hypothetical protein B7733_02305, partial [Myxococcales bacterium FL481]
MPRWSWPVVITLLPAAIVMALGQRAPGWLGPAVVFGLAAIGCLVSPPLRRAPATFALGCLFAGLTAHLAARADALHQHQQSAHGVPVVDLTRGESLPENSRTARVRGYLRPSWSLDEYHVAADQRPDQNRPAPFRLIPLLDSADAPSTSATQLVVVRIAATDPIPAGATVFAGSLRPLPSALIDTLVSVAPTQHDSPP